MWGDSLAICDFSFLRRVSLAYVPCVVSSAVWWRAPVQSVELEFRLHCRERLGGRMALCLLHLTGTLAMPRET